MLCLWTKPITSFGGDEHLNTIKPADKFIWFWFWISNYALGIMLTWSAKLTNEQSLHLELINGLPVSHSMSWEQTRICSARAQPRRVWTKNSWMKRKNGNLAEYSSPKKIYIREGKYTSYTLIRRIKIKKRNLAVTPHVVSNWYKNLWQCQSFYTVSTRDEN